jgi:hypothetical protein
MTSTDSPAINAPAAPPAKKGKGRKFATVGVLLATVAIGFALGRSGRGSEVAAAAAALPQTVTVTAAPVTVTAPPVTVQAPASAPVTVEVPAAAPPPVTVTVTEPAAPAAAPPAAAATADPGSKKNGKYLIGTQIEPGTWQCSESETLGDIDTASWKVSDQANEIISIELDTIAIVPGDGYTVDLSGCATTWTKV